MRSQSDTLTCVFDVLISCQVLYYTQPEAEELKQESYGVESLNAVGFVYSAKSKHYSTVHCSTDRQKVLYTAVQTVRRNVAHELAAVRLAPSYLYVHAPLRPHVGVWRSYAHSDSSDSIG